MCNVLRNCPNYEMSDSSRISFTEHCLKLCNVLGLKPNTFDRIHRSDNLQFANSLFIHSLLRPQLWVSIDPFHAVKY